MSSPSDHDQTVRRTGNAPRKLFPAILMRGAPLAGIFLLAMLVRGAYLYEIKGAPMMAVLLVDADAYDRWAQRILTDGWLGHEVFYQAPLYPYFLASLYSLLGRDLLLVRCIQITLGSVSCVALALAGRYFFCRRVGVLAGVVLAVYGPAIYFDGLIQKAVLDLLLMTVSLLFIARWQRTEAATWAIAAGAALGCFALTRENALVLVPVIGVWALLKSGKWTARHGWLNALAFLVGCGAMLAPVALRNWAIGGELFLTTAQFGPNFYIGNNESAEGVYTPLRPGRESPIFERRDATELAEADLGRTLTPGEVSAYWTGKAMGYIRSRPADWLRLMVRKCLLVWNAAEVPDSEDLGTYAEWSHVLRVLSSVAHFGTIAPLAVVGLCVTWGRRERLGVLYWILLSLAGSVALFYVFARYRYPMVAVLVLFAAAGVQESIGLLRRRQWPALVVWAMVCAGSAVVVNWPMLKGGDPRAVTYVNLGSALADQGRLAESADWFRRGLELQPSQPMARNSLGAVLASMGQTEEAEHEFEEALRLAPTFADAHLNLAKALSARGMVEAAIDHCRRALGGGAGELRINEGVDWEAQFLLAELLLRRGDGSAAEGHYRRALELRPQLSEASNGLARLLAGQRRFAEAAVVLREGLAHDPDDPATLNNLAWLLATCPEESVRDGAEAVRLARRACELTGYRNPQTLATLAAGLAETGRFDEAVEAARRAKDLAASQGRGELLSVIEEQVRVYSTRRTDRER